MATTVKHVTPKTMSDLGKLGFVEAPSKVEFKRAIINIESREKEGKTDLALSGPPPIIYFDIDVGGGSIVEKFKDSGKDIWVYRLRVMKLGGEKELQTLAEEQWDKLTELALAAWGLPGGTIIFDTFSEAYEIVRLARLGRLEQVKPLHYQRAYKELREMVRLAYESHMNTVFIHKVKPVWVNDKRTDQYELAGWSDIPYNVEANLQPFRTTDDEGNVVFKCVVKDCRLNAAMMGKVYDCGRAGDMPGHTLERLIDLMYRPPKKKAKLDDEEDEEEPKKKSKSGKGKVNLEEDED